MYTFREIRGNRRLLHHLKMAIQREKISHAYLLLGGAGSGKQMIVNTLAKYLLCQDRGEEPCGICRSCVVFDGGNHPDVIHVTPEKKSMGVEDIRSQILETVDLKPYYFEKKIYIVHQAHTMTVQAQNALLKTLEEPPPFAVFFLLGEQEETFLPTILSRVVTLKIAPLSEETVAAYLSEKGLAQGDEAKVFAAYAQGRIGQALMLLEEEDFRRMRGEVLDTMSRLGRMSTGQAFLLAKDWEKFKGDLRFLDMIALWYRDLLVATSLKKDGYLMQQDKKDLIFAGLQDDVPLLARKVAAVTKAKKRLGQNANFRLTMEIMLMELKENGSQ